MAYRPETTMTTKPASLKDDATSATHERLRAYVQCASDWFWQCDASGTVEFIETGRGMADLRRLAGYNAFDLLTRALPRRQAVRLRRSVALSRDFRDVRISLRLPGLPEWFLSISGQPVFGPGGRAIGYRGAIDDLTAWKNRERELLAVLSQKRRLAAVVNAVGSGIIMTDPGLPDNPIIQVNPAFCAMTGYTEDEVLGRNCRFLQGSGTDPATVDKLRRHCRDGQPVRVEILNYRKDGSAFWNDLMVAPVFDETDALEVLVGTQRDITAERERREWAQRTERLESLGQLAAGVAHDFNNILSIAQGYLETVRRNPDQNPADRAQTLTAAGQALRRGSHLTRQLLTFGCGHMGDQTAFELNRFLEDQRALLLPIVKDNVKLILQTAQDDRLNVVADPELLGQVLINLVSNADHAMPRGGRLTIRCRRVRRACLPPLIPDTKASTDYGCIMVSDSGVGIRREDLSRIFEPFATTKPHKKGHGLGLSMVYGMVTSFGGFVDVDSVVGQGTTFSLWLPLSQANQGEEHVNYASQEAAGGHGRDKTILIADDDAEMRDSLSKQAMALGFRVITAADGLTALRRAEQADIVLSDIAMPVLDGICLARSLAERYPCLPRLLMTACPEPGAIEAAEQVPVLSKPIKPETLYAALERHGPAAEKPSISIERR